MHGSRARDIVIVGGGVAGLYAAFRLLRRYPGIRLTLFEALPRVGGRLHTSVA